MSTTDTTENTAIMCPSCGEPLETAQTICAACRSALEEQVLTVRAADYPALFHNVVRNSAEQHRSPVDPTSMDMLKVAENTSDDLDLVPLVPIDEPRRTSANGSDSTIELGSSAPAPANGGSSVTEARAPLAPSPTAPAPSSASRPSYTVYSPPPSAPKLEPSSQWKHVVIAVLCVAGAAVLAAVLWSTLVPGQPAQSDDMPDARPAARRAAK